MATVVWPGARSARPRNRVAARAFGECNIAARGEPDLRSSMKARQRESEHQAGCQWQQR